MNDALMEYHACGNELGIKHAMQFTPKKPSINLGITLQLNKPNVPQTTSLSPVMGRQNYDDDDPPRLPIDRFEFDREELNNNYKFCKLERPLDDHSPPPHDQPSSRPRPPTLVSRSYLKASSLSSELSHQANTYCMPSSEATSSPPPLLKRSRSYSDEEEYDDEPYDDELDDAQSRQRRRLSSLAHPGDCHALFAPHWSVEDGGWCGSKAEDDVALLMEIEECAETYSPPTSDSTSPALFSGFVSSVPGMHSLRLESPPNPQPPPNSAHLPSPSQSIVPPPPSEKPFKCPICPKSFTRNYDLTRHKSSHQDERAHVCEYCGRSFNRRDALSRHNVVRGCGQNGRIGTRHKNGN
ncbi:hypothetical protein CROQUDRAFT_105350 [Cronartium quercuum f. sp. fusiforme G11]|uniref:C2H2-type domain-containing protein n=1 Tax=Cronartium quercuum f. sp. fusiforme G11 TaxID=708437 RepID=A0A9P6NT16_9BASI|nr:hypothetical protein CROQUDRAFT_105350 [Cronartium quercuum f. sp. fusiforme G11]